MKAYNPKHTIYLILERLKPSALKSALFDRVKVEVELEKNVRLFITRMIDDEMACQALVQQVNATDTKKKKTLEMAITKTLIKHTAALEL